MINKLSLLAFFLSNIQIASPEEKNPKQKNFVSTSHRYDDSSDSPFRFEKITVFQKDKEINIIIDYYIDVKKQTLLNLKVNGLFKNEILTKITSSKRYKQMKLNIPSTIENEILDIVFEVNWIQKFIMSARIYLNVEKKLQTKIKDPGDYKYKVINKTIFNNQNKKFSYFYNYIDFSINSSNKYPYFIKNNFIKIPTQSKIKFNSKLIFKANKEIISEKLINTTFSNILKPGDYEINLNINYRDGIIQRDLEFSYDFVIEKYFFGSCDTAYYCFKEMEINGNLKIIKKENFLI